MNSEKTTFNRYIATTTIRIILGLIFLMQGYGKVFKWGVSNVYSNFFKSSYDELLPDFILLFSAYFTSYMELIGGLLVIIGLKRDLALYGLALVLIIVSFGHGLSEPIWDLSHVMYRLILLSSLLLLPRNWDRFSIDALIKSTK